MRYFLLISVFFLYSCANTKKDVISEEKADTIASQNVVNETVLIGVLGQDSLVFPEKGNLKDFVIEPFEMQSSDEAYVSHLDKKIAVMALTNVEGDFQPVLLLVKQNDGLYHLKEVGTDLLFDRFNEDGYELYSYFDLDVDSLGTLVLSQQGLGSAGSNTWEYKFANDRLWIQSMSTFAAGAGGQTYATFDFEKGLASITDVNTMLEDMPSSTRELKMDKLTKSISEIDLSKMLDIVYSFF